MLPSGSQPVADESLTALLRGSGEWLFSKKRQKKQQA